MNKPLWTLGGIALLFVVVFLFLKVAVIHTVDAGNVGMVIDYTTSSSRPQVSIYQPGHIISTNPFGGQQFVQYPIATQSLVLASASSEGELQGNSTYPCQMAGGGIINIGAAIVWQVDPAHPDLLYFKMPGVPLTESLNNDVATKLVYGAVTADMQNTCSHYTWEQLLGDSQGTSQVNQFRQDFLALLQQDLAPDGILVPQIFLKERIPSAQINAVLNAKLQADQSAFLKIDAQNKADAQQITAQGNANAAITNAKGEAASIGLIDAALAKNPNYIEYLKVKEWDGKLPQVVGANTQVQIGPGK